MKRQILQFNVLFEYIIWYFFKIENLIYSKIRFACKILMKILKRRRKLQFLQLPNFKFYKILMKRQYS